MTFGNLTIGEANDSSGKCGNLIAINNSSSFPMRLAITGSTYQAIPVAPTTGTNTSSITLATAGSAETFTAASDNGTSGGTGTVGDTTVSTTSNLGVVTTNRLITGAVS